MILVFGSINLDLIFQLPALPAPGQTLLAADARLEPGGKGANQAVAAARDGAAVLMAGAVGRGGLAEAALAGLTRAGVDLLLGARLTASTGCASVATDALARNQIIVAPGANLLADQARVGDAVLGRISWLLLQMETDPVQAGRLAERARKHGAKVMLNLAPAQAEARDLLRHTDLLLVNEDEAEFTAKMFGTGATAAALQWALGVDVVRTMGARGAEAATDGAEFFVPAPRVEAVDTTAAGDCLAGVLAAGLDRGLSLETALRRGVVAASLACTRRGSQSSLPDYDEISRVVG